MDDASAMGGTCIALSPEEALAEALRCHQAGRLGEAAAVYEAILESDGRNVAALHLLGLIRQQQGDVDRAMDLVARAAVLRPDVSAIQASLAELCLAKGRYEDACRCARVALRSGPDNPTLRLILGSALRALGNPEQAISELRRAVEIRPDWSAAHNELGNALRALGRGEEAKAAYRTAIRLVPDSALALANLGLMLMDEGSFVEAHALLTRAVALEPGTGSMWERLADFYERVDQFDEAVPCWERALELAPTETASLHLALGRALQKVGREAESEAHYRTASALDPTSAVAQVSLGVLLAERGDVAEAENAYRSAIRLNPTYAPPHARLANLLGARLPDGDLEALRHRLDDPEIASEPRTRLLFALGQVLDARGEHASAAACFREANARQLEQIPTYRRFDPTQLDRFTTRLIQAVYSGFFQRIAGAGLASRVPVFIVGLPRSGTTLIEQVLASHARVATGGELAFGPELFRSLPAVLNASCDPEDCIPRLGQASIRLMAGDYLNRLQALNTAGADRVIDKLPENYQYLGLLLALFPEATVIHCRRDIRDVALSCWMADFRRVTWANDPTHIGAAFRSYRRIMDHWRDTVPATIHEVWYEEAVTDIEPIARRLVAALGLEWDPSCLEFHATRRPIRTLSSTQVRQPIHRRSIGRWKHYERELAELFAALPDDV